jgi:hypothetical protein
VLVVCANVLVESKVNTQSEILTVASTLSSTAPVLVGPVHEGATNDMAVSTTVRVVTLKASRKC